MYRSIKNQIIEQADQMMPDRWEAIRAGASLSAGSIREDLSLHRRPYQKPYHKYALAISAGILVLILLSVPPRSLGPCQAPEMVIPPSGNTMQATPGLTQPAQEDQAVSVHINETETAPETMTFMFAIMTENIHPLTRDELFQHYGIPPFDIADVLEGMDLIYGGFLGGEYAIYRFPSGATYDMNSFQYHREGTDQHASIIVQSGGTDGYFTQSSDTIGRAAGYFSESFDTLLTSEINGIVMTIIHYTDHLGFRQSEEVLVAPDSDIYYAWFEYKGLGFLVKGANLSEDDFTTILSYLTKL